MTRATRVLLGLCCVLVLAVPARSQAVSHPSLPLLEEEVQRLALLSGGVVGVGAIHLQSGVSFYWNTDEPFPMASTYKVPIAIQLLRRIERGETRLEKMIDLEPYHLQPGSGTISRLLDDPGVSLSVHNLLELMMLISDNTATDLLLQEAGGAEAVGDFLREIGLEGMRVDRPTVELIADWIGIPQLPPREERTLTRFRELSAAVPGERRAEAANLYDRDPRDTSTPRAMARLLEKLWRGELLSPAHTEFLLDIMRRCETGENRLKGLLPPGTVVAHKTGTVGRTTNDVGIVTLPGQAGDVVLAVFVKGSGQPVSQREQAIAHIARAVYDFFLFSPRTAGRP